MPSLEAAEARRRFLSAPVARLATVTPTGLPHIVPITFAALGPDTLVSAVDHKPKRTTALARLANLAANPSVSLLVDHYEDEWTQLWWARADGHATVLAPDPDGGPWAAAAARLTERYPQYAERPPAGPIIEITVGRWVGWQWTE
jgi:PPOX class probable F420-dependent enzyme